MDRHSRLFLPCWALVALLLASAVGAASAPVPFTLRFGASGSLTILIDPTDAVQAFELGFATDATLGYDPFLDFPKPTSGSVLNLYFPAEAPVMGLSKDFRPPAASASWQMELTNMAADSSVTLAWRLQNGDLAGNVLRLKDRLSGAVLVANMMTTSSTVLAAPSRSLLVVYEAPSPDDPEPGDPDGDFDLVYQGQTSDLLRPIWYLTGHYEANVGGHQLILDLVHDERGTLSGVGSLSGTVGGKGFTVANMPVRGSCSGKNGTVMVRASLAGASGTTAVSLKLSLALAAADRTLTGTATGRITDTVAGRLLINAPCVLALDAAMDGTYQLPTHLDLGTRGAVTGSSTLTLANGDLTVPLLVTGQRRGNLTNLQFVGNKTADPAFAAISFKMTLGTFADGKAGIRALAGKAFGQTLSWHL